MFVQLSQQNLISTIALLLADIKLGRCVAGTKMQVEFDDESDRYNYV